MPSREIDAYLAELDEPKRSTLRELRSAINELAPGVEETMSYRLPAFRIDGTLIAGFGAFKHHLSYFPHSGSVLPALGDEIAGYRWSRGALQFPIDVPLPVELVATLIEVRLAQAFPEG
jgi:uncharacterized protein YdhG (YjbR/CyaY superfamily)